MTPPTRPSLDIVMPLFGRTDQFQQAVRSVLAQDDPGWRLVVIDDHNPDPESADWFRELGDPRLEYRRTLENLGPGPVFQLALEAAIADRVVIMGCDDALLPGFVARIRALAAAAPETEMIQPGVRVIGSDGQRATTLADSVKALTRPRHDRPVRLSGDRLAASLLHGNWLYFPSIAWRTDVVQRIGFRTDRHIVQDLTLELEIILEGGEILLDPVPSFLYRRHDASASSRARVDGTRFREESALFAEVGDRALTLGWKRTRRAARTHWTSRFNAVLGVPRAAQARDGAAVRVLARHAVGLGRPASRIRP